MSPRESTLRSLADAELTRREALSVGIGGGLALGAGTAVDNVFVGYGVLVGTNLLEQDLESKVAERFTPSPYETSIGDYRLRYLGELLVLEEHGRPRERLVIAETTPAEAAEIDEAYGLDGSPVEQLVRDLRAVAMGEVTFEFSQYEVFFERLASADLRRHSVGAMRGTRFASVDPAMVETIAGVPPTDPAGVVEGLASGFREHSHYDVARYAAGSVEDNLLFGTVDLRGALRTDTSLDAIVSGENDGLFCYDLAYRSIEALHAVAPIDQSPPVVGAVVTDARHKHVYTGIASLLRDGSDLVVPMTFVDYTHSTLYDDLGLRWLLGEGLRAYDDRHRTTDVFWNRYGRW